MFHTSPPQKGGSLVCTPITLPERLTPQSCVFSYPNGLEVVSEMTVLLVVVVAVDAAPVVGSRAPEMLERRVYAQQQREQSQYSEASAAFTHTLDEHDSTVKSKPQCQLA